MSETPSHLDMGRLARLGAFDDPAVAGIIARFLDSLDDRIEAMASASVAGDIESLIRQAYQLRGSAANCGFSVLAAACDALEASPAAFNVRTFRKLAGSARKTWQDAGGH
jgi:HPt (histidine-containing phosphotransfer) domain-containing protein